MRKIKIVNEKDDKRLKFWTESAVACYKRGCRCQGCPIPHPTQNCLMKSVVKELVRVKGNPDKYLEAKRQEERRNREILSFARQALERGETIRSIAKHFGESFTKMQSYLNTNGIYAFSYRRMK